MPLTNWLRNWRAARQLPKIGSNSRRARRSTSRSRFRPCLEALENRWLPSTLTVLNTADSGPGSLRATIAAAQSRDTINFDSSLTGQSIILTSGELVIDKSLDIEGPASDPPTINIFNSGSSRGFDITDGSTTVTLAHVSVFARIFDAGATLNLIRDDVTGGASGASAQGGAIYQAGGTLSLSHCVVEGGAGGSSTGQGGGIYNVGGTLNLADCLIACEATGTALAAGGGIYDTAGATLTASGTRFDFNEVFAGTAPGDTAMGGAIYQADGSLSLTNCSIGGSNLQSANVYGGAIYLGGGTASIVNSTLGSNYAAATGLGQGGAIYVATGTLTLTNTSFSGNTAFGSAAAGSVAQGGALYVAGGTVTIANCSFFQNAAYGYTAQDSGVGGALYIAGGSVCITSNTTFQLDFASQGYSEIYGPYTIC